MKKEKNEGKKLIDIGIKIPFFTSWEGNHDMPIKNEPMFEFKDGLELGRIYNYLNDLPEKEKYKKLKNLSKYFPEIKEALQKFGHC